MSDTCPCCGAATRSARHYRGRGVYVVETWCAEECGWRADDTEGDF